MLPVGLFALLLVFPVLACFGRRISPGGRIGSGGRSGDSISGEQSRGRNRQDDGKEYEELFHVRKMTPTRIRSYALARNFCKRASTRSLPSTRNMLVMLGPALVPDTARRATAW